MKACAQIMSSTNPQHFLRRISSRLPDSLKAMSRVDLRQVSPLLLPNQSREDTNNVADGASMLLLNNRMYYANNIDIFRICSAMLAEHALIDELMRLLHACIKDTKLHDEECHSNISFRDTAVILFRSLLGVPFKPSTSSIPRWFINGKYVQWLNNLEGDSNTENLPSDPNLLILSENPQAVSKNIINYVAVLDPSTRGGLQTLAHLVQAYLQSFPVRFGVILVDQHKLQTSAPITLDMEDIRNVENDMSLSRSKVSLAEIIISCFFFLSENDASDPTLGYKFLYKLAGTKNVVIDKSLIVSTLNTFTTHSLTKILKNRKWYATYKEAMEYVRKSGRGNEVPATFMNGNPLAKDLDIAKAVDEERVALRPLVKKGLLNSLTKDSATNIAKNLGSVIHLQPALYTAPKYVTLSIDDYIRVLQSGNWISDDKDTRIFNLSHIVVSDIRTLQGIDSLLGIVSQIVNGTFPFKNGNEHENAIRVAFYFIGSSEDFSIRAITSALSTQSFSKVLKIANYLREAYLSNLADASTPSASKPRIHNLSESLIHDFSLQFPDNMDHPDKIDYTRYILDERIAAQVCGALPAFLISNGRCVDLSTSNDGMILFSKEDFALFNEQLLRLFTPEFSAQLNSILHRLNVNNGTLSAFCAVFSLIVDKDARKHGDRDIFYTDCLPGLPFSPNNRSHGLHSISAIINPLSPDASKLLVLANLLYEKFTLSLRIFLNPKRIMFEIPSPAYYEYAFNYDWVPHDNLHPPIVFHDLPKTVLYTMSVQEPVTWLSFPSRSHHDLDNIFLENGLVSSVKVQYELRSLVLSGSCTDRVTGQPVPGLPLFARKSGTTETRDTTVMSNFGYFQLQLSPGKWTISILEGDWSKKYRVVHVSMSSEFNMNVKGSSFSISIDKFSDLHLEIKVERCEASYGKDATTTPFYSDSGVKGVPATNDPRVHIFSIASGFLYERFLRLMMYTLTNHTKARVKFWLVENFLSPSFKRVLPQYAKSFGCDYELVTYKWPDWLHAQSEKQRLIWAYKVLFLDVLFPLSVQRIIFVDADQVIRSDVQELYNMDLQGHAVGYTPFCTKNARKETEGFRFWKHGFWKTHLQGKNYHISAIYVVDLTRFRERTAGDVYRTIYDSLAGESHSLANLDQDLPNYVQEVVPIFSLPEEWLWCETWCDDRSKARAKTIDLCNNPLTKTPKLHSARRIIPEWTTWDAALASLESSFVSYA